MITYGVLREDWRVNVRAEDLDHYEAWWVHHQTMAEQAKAAGVTYRDVPWYEARGRRELIGKRATRAYWIGGGETPWGHQHAHMYAFAFKVIKDIGSDWILFEGEDSEPLISYDTLCVQEPITD